MKTTTTILERAVNIAIIVILLLPITVGTIGCGDTEDPLDPTTDIAQDTAAGIFAKAKYNDTAPAAPSAPQGTPRVTEVGFYHDWKLTKPATSPVQPGKTIFIKIVFSEPMKHVVSDGKEARPILYYKQAGKELVRFKMAAHGAGGKNFVSGDAKPFGSGTNDYICKYVVPKGKIAVMVGKYSVDLQGNPLASFYRHPVKLEVRQPPAPKPSEPIEQVEATDQEDVDDRINPPPTQVEGPVTHKYYNGVVISDIWAPSAWVFDFPGPFKHYTPPASRHGDFVGRVVMPVWHTDPSAWARDGVAPVSNVIVTITQGPRRGEWVSTDEGGYYHFRDVVGDNLYLRVERSYLEPKEVIVHRHRPTTLQRMGPNRVFIQQYRKQENTPGTILMGLRWPDAVRHILEDETLPHDPLYVMAPTPHRDGVPAAGRYVDEDGLILVFHASVSSHGIMYNLLGHELAHARQHAVAATHGVDGWENTPEGRAYNAAWEKDLREAPGKMYILDEDDYLNASLLENAAQFCAMYWELGTGIDAYLDGDPVWSMQTRAPNRWKWAEKYLNTRY